MRPVLGAILMLAAALVSQESSAPKVDEAGRPDLITQVRNMPASELDRALPPTKLEDWLLVQAAPDAKIGWVLRQSSQMPDCVEADVMLKDGRSFVVLVDVGTNPRWPRLREINLMTSSDNRNDMHRLRDLPGALRLSGSRASVRAEGKK